MSTTFGNVSGLPCRAGVGLRLPHLLEVAAERPAIAWFEIHPETFLENPHALDVLRDLATDYLISVHTVGVSVGSVHGIDRAHLARVVHLANALRAPVVSGHLAWSTHPGAYLNDLLPLPYTAETLEVVARHVDVVQQALGRPFVVENPSSYVGFAGSTMPEPEFLNRLATRTGCHLLCDVSNVYLSAANLEFDPVRYLDELEPTAVVELHLGGFRTEVDDDAPGDSVLIDSHDTAVADAAWRLAAHALARFGPRPVLIEWDSDLPTVARLHEEALFADRLLPAWHDGSC
jgi:uncharacterized protein